MTNALQWRLSPNELWLFIYEYHLDIDKAKSMDRIGYHMAVFDQQENFHPNKHFLHSHFVFMNF